jgi:hypothetical protein
VIADIMRGIGRYNLAQGAVVDANQPQTIVGEGIRRRPGKGDAGKKTSLQQIANHKPSPTDW